MLAYRARCWSKPWRPRSTLLRKSPPCRSSIFCRPP